VIDARLTRSVAGDPPQHNGRAGACRCGVAGV